MNRSSYRTNLPTDRTPQAARAAFRQGKRPGQANVTICPFCYRRDRIRFDLGVLTGYGADRGTQRHLGHIGRDLAADEQITNGTYAEKLRGEFESTLTELNSIIAAAKIAKDSKTVFDAMRVKNDTLKAMGRAFGLASPVGRPSKRAKDTPEQAGAVARDDVAAVIKSAEAIQNFHAASGSVNGGEVAGMGVETEGGEPG